MSSPSDLSRKAAEKKISDAHLAPASPAFGMGSTGQRRPDDDNEGGSGGSGLQRHPLISKTQQFSGMPDSADAQNNQDTESNAKDLAPEKRPSLTMANDLTNSKSATATPLAGAPTPHR